MKLIFIFLLLANAVVFIQAAFFTKGAISSAEKFVAPAVPTAPASLVLLSERPELAKEKTKAVVSNDANQVQGSAMGEALCTMVGPFVQLLHAEYLIENLAALGVKAQIANLEIGDGEVFWVYLAPELSEKEALRRLYELQKKNIESYIITKGDLANGISFGQYADSLEASARAEQLKDQGYNALIKSISKTIKETWVVLEPGADEKISDKAWVGLLNAQESLEKRQNFCSGVASQ